MLEKTNRNFILDLVRLYNRKTWLNSVYREAVVKFHIRFG